MRSPAGVRFRGAVLGIILPCLAGAHVGAGAQETAAVVFLVRHAERDGPDDDAGLTAPGRERALLLARTLGSASFDRVLSTDYVRTRETARPSAERAGVAIETYDAGDLEAVAAELRAAGGRALVVGHSDTTPALVRALGGEPGPPIRDADEYDRLYVVVLPARGPPETVLLRYGAPPR